MSSAASLLPAPRSPAPQSQAPKSPAPVPASLEERILDAALSCISRWGLSKTTLDDVARQALCSRATVYRVFPGGKEALLHAVARREVHQAAAAIGAALDAAGGLADGLADALSVAAGLVACHSALQFLRAHEPEAVVPWLAFGRGEELLEFAANFAAPHLGRWLPPAEAHRAAEWAARIVLSFCFCPSPNVDLVNRDSARWVVNTFMIPGLWPPR